MQIRTFSAGAGVIGLAAVLAAAGIPGAAAPAVPMSDFTITGARTLAEVQTSASGAESIRLGFSAALLFDGLPDLSDDVAIGWQEVGGVDPIPFRILIPAGCFVELRRDRGFAVRDFRSCGVEMLTSRGAGLVRIDAFTARLAMMDDGSYRLNVTAMFADAPADIPPDPIHEFVDLLAGRVVEIGIASASSMAPPLRAVTVSGIEPTPF